MPSDPKNVKLGVCSVSYNGVDLGYTKGGVEVSIKTDTKKVMVDQLGSVAIDEYITGRTVTVKAPLAETTIDNLALIMPGSAVSGTGATRKIEVTTGIGVSLRDLAKVLTLHPINKLASDKSEDFTLPLAGVVGDLDYAYKLDDERVWNATFNAYPDANNKLYVVGAYTPAV